MSLSAGKHVLVEKPFTESAARTRTLIDLAAASGLQLCSVHQCPFQRGMQGLQRGMGRLGRPIRIDYCCRSTGGQGLIDEQRRELLLEILPHPHSLFFSLLGRPLEECVWSVNRFTADDLEVTGRLDDLRLRIDVSLRGRPVMN